MLLHGPKMSENTQFWGRMYFPTKYLPHTPKFTPKPHFRGPFNAKPIIQRTLHKSHVHGATKLKLYSYIGIHKSSVDFRWSWTLPPVWSSVFADTNTSCRLFATCFIGSQCHSSAYRSKIAIYAFDCVRQHCLAYFNNVCIPVAGISGRANRRSAELHAMIVPSTRIQLGRRSFHVEAPTVWNALPSQLRSSSISRGQFRAG